MTLALGDNPDLFENTFVVTTPFNGTALPVHALSFTMAPVGAVLWSEEICTIRWNEGLPQSDPLENLSMVASGDATWLSGNPLRVSRSGVERAFGKDAYTFGRVAQGSATTFQLGVCAPYASEGAVDIEITFQDGPYAVLFGSREVFPCTYGGAPGIFERVRSVHTLLVSVLTVQAETVRSSFTWSLS